MNPTDFIATIAPPALESAKRTKIPASFTVAQAALESGWGKSLLATRGRNLFGVKAGHEWKGAVLTLNTREFIGGKWVLVEAHWRKYFDWLDSIEDHANFLLFNPRYKPAFAHPMHGEDFAKVVQGCGYATDPNYADKIITVIRSHDLASLDKETA
jgi:flagellum-specific peptidoglycan hydrolase FlgJ